MNTFFRLSTLLVLTSLLICPLWADSESTKTTSDSSDVTVVVTDTATPHPVSESISTISVITAQQIRENKAETVADVLRTIPGVTLRQNGDPGSPATLSIRGSKPSQVLVLVDGERVSSQAFIGGVDLSKFLVDQVSRIEVIRGPASALYGSEAFGGVINIITKQPSVSGVDVTYTEGKSDHQERAFTARYVLPSVQYLVSGSFPYFNGDRPNSDYAGTDFTGRVILPSAKGWELSLYGESYRDLQGNPGSEFQPSITNRQWNNRTNLELSGKHAIADGQLTVRVYDTAQQMSNKDSAWGTDSLITGKAGVVDANYVRQFGAHQLLCGLEYRNETYEDREGGFAPTLANNSIYNRALFVQDNWMLNPKTDLVYGARLDDHSTAGSKVTPRIGINRQIVPNINARASYSAGFRAPNFVELYYNNYGTTGNKNLRPETSEQFELGLNMTLARTTYDFSVYQVNGKDQIVWGPYDDPNHVYSATYTNVGSTRQRGAEFSIGRSFSSFLKSDLTYTYIDSRDTSTDTNLPGIPHSRLALTNALDFFKWNAALTGRWVSGTPDSEYREVVKGRSPAAGPTYGNVPVRIPGKTIFDLTLTYQGKKAVKPYIIIRNVFNTPYEEVAGFPGQGRSVQAGVRTGF